MTRLRAHCGPLTYRRTAERCKGYIEAVAREADIRLHGDVLDLDSYIALRRDNSAVRICFELTGVALDTDLPDEVVEHPAFMKMQLAAVDMVWWANVSSKRLRDDICF